MWQFLGSVSSAQNAEDRSRMPLGNGNVSIVIGRGSDPITPHANVAKPFRIVFLDGFNNPICACHVEDIESIKRERGISLS